VVGDASQAAGDAAAVPLEKFEIPAGWKRIEPKPKETPPKEFTCPTAAGS
jgi:hypothetical protein